MQNRIFQVCDEPYSVWGPDLEDRNKQFISRIDGKYFEYLASNHVGELDGESAQHAAIAIRTSYYMCLESFFGLICATLQSPDFIPGWLLKAKNHQLRELVECLRAGRKFPHIKWQAANPYIDFDAVSSLVHQYTVWAKNTEDKTVEHMATLWSRLADDFVNPYCINEYNSIKHGVRVRKGGFSLAVGLEREYGVPAPPEEMKTIGYSKFGTSCDVVAAIKDVPLTRNDRHFTVTTWSLNWGAEATAQKMMLASLSIENVKSFLEIISGKQPTEVKFQRLEDASGYNDPWNHSVGVASSSMGPIVRESDIYRATNDEIVAKLREQLQH